MKDAQSKPRKTIGPAISSGVDSLCAAPVSLSNASLPPASFSYSYLAPATFVAALGGHWGNFIALFILWFFVVAVWPLVIRKEANR